MKRGVLAAILLAISGCSQPIALRTYDNDFLTFPDDLPNDKPILLAFLNADQRTNDSLIRPLKSLSSRGTVTVVGVMTYTDNAFVDQITYKSDLVFPVLLDPQRKMFDRYGISRYPTYLLLNPEGKEIAREYDIAKLNGWYKSIMIDRAMGRRHIKGPEEDVGD